MSKLKALIKRDTKLFFKDKGMFFTSLITPLILLFLYSTFLNNVYRDTFSGSLENMGNGFTAPDKLINGCVGGQLFSSLLAVCCVTVSFCSNMLMVQDKVTGARHDLGIAPVKKLNISFRILYFHRIDYSYYLHCCRRSFTGIHSKYRLVFVDYRYYFYNA